MLQSLKIENFTVFRQASFNFSSGLNVIHGVNGTGKSHVLKLAYALQHGLASPPPTGAGASPRKTTLQAHLATEIFEVFRPDSLGRLTTRTQGRAAARVQARFVKKSQRTSFTFHSASKSEVALDEVPERWLERPPVFFPTREALTLHPGFVSLYDTHAIEFDRTWRDLCVLLGAPVARGVKSADVQRLLSLLEDDMGGRIELDKSGRFYLVDDSGRIEMHLVAEGLRKLAMVARLIATGSLVGKGCLLWDEPEANLNPQIIRRVARLLCELSAQGAQVFVATHSLFLMRELHVLLKASVYRKIGARYFGLHKSGGEVAVSQGPDIADSGDVAALDEELEQSDRYLDTESGVVR